MNKLFLDFDKGNGLIPTIIQDYQTHEVYMLGYSNEESLKKTRESGTIWFYSRSKKRLWMKGEESGNILEVRQMYTDCDNDTILIQVKRNGNRVCHTGNVSCFYKLIE